MLNSDSMSGSIQHTPYTRSYESVIQREVQVFRLRYLCSQSATRFRQYIRRRTLHGGAVYITLFLMFLERLAYYAVVGNITDPFLKSLEIPILYQLLIQTALFEMVANVMFPIFGFLGDRYIGRFHTVHISMWILLGGYVSFAFSSSFERNFDNNDLSHHVNRILLPICFIIISVGSAGFQANMIPLGADQIMGRPSDEISAYFYWYYWIRNVGALIFVLSFTCTFPYNSTVFGCVSAICISVGLIILQFTRNKLYIDNRQHNPYKLVFQVISFVARVKRPWLRSAFSYTGVEAPSRMDLAKTIHGGKFTNCEVEDVKTFVRLLVFLLSLVGVLTVYTGVLNAITTQIKYMTVPYINTLIGSCTSVWVVNILFIVLAIPIINYCLYPFLREYTPNMQKRIGIGHFLVFLSPFFLLLLSSVGFSRVGSQSEVATHSCMFVNTSLLPIHLDISSYYILIPHVLASLAEIFIVISSLEFFYAQSPHTMRGMMIGLFFFTWGIATVIANLIIVVFSNIHIVALTCDIWYYILLVILSVLFFVLFILVSVWYKNRRRGDIEPDLYYREQ